jgi:serine/threonine-protein kinase
MTSDSTVTAGLPAADLRRIDAICDRFEADWRSGRRPDLAAFLSEGPPGSTPSLFRDLLGLELEFRHALGERPTARSYHQRFPGLVAIVDAVFATGASAMMARGRAGADDRTSELTLSAPALVPSATEASPWDEFTLNEALPPVLPGYDIVAELGRGGMGVVLKAHQVALNRPVALKMIKSGSFASEQELLRFQNEAEAVAHLDHPHIVPIYEVGRHRGRQFFSMKLITGGSLDKRLADFAADPRAAARTVATVAEAVHHAHQAFFIAT